MALQLIRPPPTAAPTFPTASTFAGAYLGAITQDSLSRTSAARKPAYSEVNRVVIGEGPTPSATHRLPHSAQPVIVLADHVKSQPEVVLGTAGPRHGVPGLTRFVCAT